MMKEIFPAPPPPPEPPPVTTEPVTTEVVEEVTEAPATIEVAKDVETVDAEAVAVVETPADESEVEPEVVPDPVVFDADQDDIAVTIEKADKVLEPYELPDEVKLAFDALKAKATATPSAELSVYGDTEAIKSSLERNNLLFSVTETPQGEFRPNTDKFITELETVAPEKVDWLFFDIANTPSTRYPKMSRFDEALVDHFGTVGEPIGDVMSRVQQVKEFMAQGLPQGDMPSFIPTNLRQAYFSLEPASRADIEALESIDEYNDALYTDADRSRKVNELAKIQRGIDADRMEAQRLAQQQATERTNFNTRVVETQNKVFSGVRDAFTESLKKEVKFSDNTQVQTLLCHQQVTTLQQAFLPDSDGEFARKALADANVKFDFPKAQAIIRDIEKASVEYTLIQGQVDAHGNQMNTVELNKAANRLQEATRKFQSFGEDIIRQEKNIAAAGTKESVDKAVEKRKLELKTRPAVKTATAGVKQTKTAGDKPPENIVPFSKEWDEWYADKTIAQNSK